MAVGNDALILGKKAFVSTLVAIALNPIGIAVGYGVGKWLQAPRLGAPTVLVDAQTEGVRVPPELMSVLQNIGGIPFGLSLSQNDRERLRQGVLSATAVPNFLNYAEDSKGRLASYKIDLEANIAATQKWNRGQELILRPIDREGVTSEAPQTIANRDKNELLGIYRSSLNATVSRLDGLTRMIEFLQSLGQSDSIGKRTGEATITVGVLNSGDSEGVVYPKAVLHSPVGDIDLTAKPNEPSQDPFGGPESDTLRSSGGYIVVPPRSFREAAFVMDRSTRGDAADRWKKLVQSSRGDEITIDLQTSGGALPAKGNLPR